MGRGSYKQKEKPLLKATGFSTESASVYPHNLRVNFIFTFTNLENTVN